MMSDAVGTLHCFRKLRHVSVEWEIKNYFKTRLKVGYPFISPEFWFLDAQWYLSIDCTGDPGHWISLSLGRDHAQTKKHHVAFTLGIHERGGSVLKSLEFDHVFSKVEEKKWDKFLKLSDLKNVLGLEYNCTLNLFCNMWFRESGVTDTACQTGASESTLTLTENLKDLCLNGLYSDITLTVKDQEFKAHKSILASRSPVFASMFNHSIAEEHSGVMDIPDVDTSSFKDFLLFLYTGEICEMSWDNVYDMYKIADKYDLKELKKKCIQFIIRNLSVTSFCHAVKFAVFHDEQELLKITIDFFIDNVYLILPTAEWHVLKTHHRTLANELLSIC